MSNKLKGFCLIILAIGVFVMTVIFNNNDNKIATELYNNYENVSSTEVKEENNGKLVATNGEITLLQEELTDEDFNVSVSSAVLKRKVEVFVWTEEQTTENGQTSYTYRKKWSDELIDSSKFRFQDRYINPKKISYESKTIYNNQVKLGAFTLGENELKQLSVKTKLTPNVNKKKLPKGFSIVGDYITDAKNIESPEVGNIRISYTYNVDSSLSVLAKQNGTSFDYYKTKNEKQVDVLLSGIKNGEEIIKYFENNNYTRNNILVIIALVLTTLGIIKLMKKE